MQHSPLSRLRRNRKRNAPTSLVEHINRQNKHDNPNRRTSKVLEFTDRFHTVTEQEQLKRPHQDKCNPAKDALAEEHCVSPVDPRFID